MNYFQATKSTFFTNLYDFKGRATRTEFCYAWLTLVCFNILVHFATGYIPAWVFITYRIWICISLGSVGARCLHENGRSGWWTLLSFTIVGIPILFYLCLRKQTCSTKQGDEDVQEIPEPLKVQTYDDVEMKNPFKEFCYESRIDLKSHAKAGDIGTDYFIKGDYDQAIPWLRKAAEQGDPIDQYILGLCYSIGLGVEQDYRLAFEWEQKAADQGLADAQSDMGDFYREGLGVEKNYKTAVSWYKKSAEQGYAGGVSGLGLCYVAGLGIDTDSSHDYFEEGKRLLQQAADQGFRAAKMLLKRLDEQQSEDE